MQVGSGCFWGDSALEFRLARKQRARTRWDGPGVAPEDDFVGGRGRICFMIRPYQGVVPVVPVSCYVDVSAQVIGDVVLGEQASVWMNAVVRGDVNSIRIGAKSNVQDCAVLHGMRYVYPVIVGEMVPIGHNASVHGCVLEDAVLVGIGATILNNARIGEGSIIAAGVVLHRWRADVPPLLS